MLIELTYKFGMKVTVNKKKSGDMWLVPSWLG